MMNSEKDESNWEAINLATLPNNPLQRRPRRAVLMVSRNTARGPAERGR
jgi:hypothetical protein